MATHKCGTCFFFQEAGFAGNGWCLHADRAKSADVRTLVRRNELACRNDWGQSLWTDPKAAAETGAARKLITAQAERPATEGEIGAMVNTRDSQPDPRASTGPDDRPAGEDVVVGQITVMPPGQTGRRRLLDQVPVEIPQRPSFRDVSSDERPVGSTSPPAAHHASPLVDDAGDRTWSGNATPDSPLAGRDRLRQRDVAPAPDRRRDHDDERPRLNRDPQSVALRPVLGSQPDERQPSLSSARDLRSDDESRTGSHRDDPVDPRSHPSQGHHGSPDLPRGVPPAPIPGPVPARELRRERTPDPRGPEDSTPRTVVGQRSSHRADQRPGAFPRFMPVPRSDAGGEISGESESRSPAQRRPVLPDLSDDLFTRGAIESAATVGDAQQRLARSQAGERQPDRTDEGHPGQTVGAQPARSRPAVPRLRTEPGRPVEAVRSIPTVAEANQVTWTPVMPAMPRSAQVSQSVPPPRPETGWATPRPAPPARATAQPIPVMASEGRDRDDVDDRQREPVRLEPPTPLRPQAVDFGEYGGWFDLQSVEPRLSPDLQRACSTCRDFRPAENGVRGWCTNRDAFTLRTVVNASDLPCISSFGCWWVPFDDVWLSEAAIRDHHNPTPLLDQTIAPEEVQATARQRRRS